MAGYRAVREAFVMAHTDMKHIFMFFSRQRGLTDKDAEGAWEAEHQRLICWRNEVPEPD